MSQSAEVNFPTFQADNIGISYHTSWELRKLNKWLQTWCREEDFGFLENWVDFTLGYLLYGYAGLHLNGEGAAMLGKKMDRRVEELLQNIGGNKEIIVISQGHRPQREQNERKWGGGHNGRGWVANPKQSWLGKLSKIMLLKSGWFIKS